MTTKIHPAVDARGTPTRFLITPGHASEVRQSPALIDVIPAEAVTADRGYGGGIFVKPIAPSGAEAVIPLRRSNTCLRVYHEILYGDRNNGERFTGRLQTTSPGGLALRHVTGELARLCAQRLDPAHRPVHTASLPTRAVSRRGRLPDGAGSLTKPGPPEFTQCLDLRRIREICPLLSRLAVPRCPRHMSDTWLSLTASARRLGVHPTTLRRWANDGEIACMLTPGGHRRFLESDLRRFEGRARREAEDRPSTQVVTWGADALKRTRTDIGRHSNAGWLAPLDEAARAEHRQLGQHLMALLLQYVSREIPGPEIEDEIRITGHAYGQQARLHGLRLAQALSATMFFRESLSEAALAPPGSLGRHTEHNAQLLRRLNRFINLTQLAVVDAYDGTTAGH